MGTPWGLGIAAIAMLSGGCTTLATVRERQAQQDRVAHERVLAEGKAFALKRTVVARGSRTCAIVQWESAYKTEREAQRRATSSFETERGTVPGMAVPSRVSFSVEQSGAVRMRASSSTYPHSDMFFVIEGTRLRARENVGIPITGRALQALIDEKPFDYSYFTWPSGERAGRDVFRGFRDVLTECRGYVAGAPA